MTSKALWDGALGRGWMSGRTVTGACGLRMLACGAIGAPSCAEKVPWGRRSLSIFSLRAMHMNAPRRVEDRRSCAAEGGLRVRERIFMSTRRNRSLDCDSGLRVGLGRRYFSVQPARSRKRLPEEDLKAEDDGIRKKEPPLRKPSPRHLDTEAETTSSSSSVAPSSPSPSPTRAIRKIIPPLASLASLTPHENIYTVPNLLTFSRLVAAPFVGYAILHDAHAWALGLFVYAGVTDLLDGWIARRWGLKTVVGSVIDPMADKTLMTVLTVCLAWQGGLPIWLAAIILGRDVGLAIAAIYYRWISLPPPKTMARYWDFSLPSAEVRPTTISKYNTFLQLALMGSTVVAPLLLPMGLDVGLGLTGLQYIVATTTIWSGLSYVFSKDAVKILTKRK